MFVLHFFFLGFFFFDTPPPTTAADGVVVDKDPGMGLLRASSIVGGASGAADDEFSGCLFCIFCIKDRFKASNLFKKTDEYVLNLMHWWLKESSLIITDTIEIRLAVVLSVIFKTNLPSHDLHFMLYRACKVD